MKRPAANQARQPTPGACLATIRASLVRRGCAYRSPRCGELRRSGIFVERIVPYETFEPQRGGILFAVDGYAAPTGLRAAVGWPVLLQRCHSYGVGKTENGSDLHIVIFNELQFRVEHHAGQQRLETAQVKGERIVAEELGRLRLTEEQLLSRRECDRLKLEVAARLRGQTLLTVKEIAARLQLGLYQYVQV